MNKRKIEIDRGYHVFIDDKKNSLMYEVPCYKVGKRAVWHGVGKWYDYKDGLVWSFETYDEHNVHGVRIVIDEYEI